MIPNILHFCFAFQPDAEFGLLEHLAIKSASDHNRPERIYVYHHYDLTGEWWERTRPLVVPTRVDPPTEIFGRGLHHFAHRADVVRLWALLEHGGIYLDIDTLCLRSFTELRRHPCVMARQGDRGLCNAVMLSEPGAHFLQVWLASYRLFRSPGRAAYWDEHSVRVPAMLARCTGMDEAIHILDEEAFFYPSWEEMSALFESSDEALFSRSYCVHYWETLTRERWLRHVTLDSILAGQSNFDRFARRHLDG